MRHGAAAHWRDAYDRTSDRRPAARARDFKRARPCGHVLAVPPLADDVLRPIVARLMPDHERQFGLVAHPQQRAGPHDQHAVRRHHRVEPRLLDDVHAQIRAVVRSDLARDAADIGIERRIADELRRGLQLAFRAVHRIPQRRLVAARGGTAARAAATSGSSAARPDQQPPAARTQRRAPACVTAGSA